MADFSKQQTALTIIQEVCGQLGLPVPAAAVAGLPTDATPAQMVALLTYAGRRLCKPTQGYRWTLLTKTFQLDTVPGTTLYPVPTDWDSFQDITGWNWSTRLPMVQAGSPQWAALKARRLGGTTIALVYRMRGGQLELFFSPSTSQHLEITYTSRGWLLDADNITYRDYIKNDSDVVLFDPELMQVALKLRFLTTKGFDTNAAQSEYDDALEAAMNADSDAPVLSASSGNQYPLLGYLNTPETGYGV